MRTSSLLVLLAGIALYSGLALSQEAQCVRDQVGTVYCPQQHQPVDLSRIGLEGIDSYNRNQESQARAEALRAQARALEAQTRALEAQQRRDNLAHQQSYSDGLTVTCTVESQTTMLCPNLGGELVRYRREE